MTIDAVANALKASVSENHPQVVTETLRLVVYRGDIDDYLQQVISTAQGLLDVEVQLRRLELDALKAHTAAITAQHEQHMRDFEVFRNSETRGIH
jgi:hypothetical protein